MRNFALILLFLFQSFLFGQKVSDSLFRAATMDVYEHPERSIEIGEKMLKTAEKKKDRVSALLLISTAYSSQREYENSLQYALKAKELSESAGDILSQLKVINKIAAQYHQMRINDKALQYLDEFDKLLENYPYKDSARLILGNNYGVRGFIYRDKLNCEIAIDYFNSAIKQFRLEKNNPMMRANISVILYNKGNCFISLNKNDSARQSFIQSIELAKNINAKSLQAFSQKGLAETLTLEGKYKDALAELKSADENAKEVGDLVLNQGLYKGLSDNYLALNDWEGFQTYYRKNIQVEQQIKKAERNSIGISLKKHLEETENQMQKIRNQYFSAIAIGVLAILILSILIVWKQKKFRRKFRQIQSKLYPQSGRNNHF